MATGKADTNLFTAMGLDYVFVKDGNDIESLIAAFSKVKDSNRPVAVHIVTEKGKGLSFAEEKQGGLALAYAV
ncbi:MAG: 1-deoxy-D-xylulose-5-phosphate synthase N-terminal domain-containing protein [[Eubacterium] siraeum]